MPPFQQNKQVESATQSGGSAIVPTERKPSLMQQRLAAIDAAEHEAAKWRNRLKRAVYSVAIGAAGTSLALLAIAFPRMYPRDLEGLGILLGVSVVLAVFFIASYFAQEWVESRREQYWLWRTSSVLLFLGIAGGMLYILFVTADFWLPHFR
jgi:hypothetical protein